MAFLLSAFVDGELDRRDQQRVETHLSRCSNCARELEGLRNTLGVVGRLADAEAPGGLTDAIRLAVQAEGNRSGCAGMAELFSAYVDHELSREESMGVRLHTESCRRCAAQLRTTQRAASMVRSLPAVDPPLGLRSKVLARTTGRPKVAPIFSYGAPSLALAGLLLFLFFPAAPPGSEADLKLPVALSSAVMNGSAHPSRREPRIVTRTVAEAPESRTKTAGAFSSPPNGPELSDPVRGESASVVPAGSERARALSGPLPVRIAMIGADAAASSPGSGAGFIPAVPERRTTFWTAVGTAASTSGNRQGGQHRGGVHVGGVSSSTASVPATIQAVHPRAFDSIGSGFGGPATAGSAPVRPVTPAGLVSASLPRGSGDRSSVVEAPEALSGVAGSHSSSDPAVVTATIGARNREGSPAAAPRVVTLAAVIDQPLADGVWSLAQDERNQKWTAEANRDIRSLTHFTRLVGSPHNRATRSNGGIPEVKVMHSWASGF